MKKVVKKAKKVKAKARKVAKAKGGEKTKEG